MRRVTGETSNVAGGMTRHHRIGVTLPAFLPDFGGGGAAVAKDSLRILRGLNVRIASAVAGFATLSGFVRSRGNGLLFGNVAGPASLFADKLRLVLRQKRGATNGKKDDQSKPRIHATSLVTGIRQPETGNGAARLRGVESNVQARTTRARQSDGPNAIKGGMQILTEQVNHLQTGFTMIAQELEQVLALDECDLHVVHDLSGKLVRFAGHGGAQAKNLAGAGDAQHQAFTVFGTDRQLHPAFAEHEDTARQASFMKQDFAASNLGDFFDAVEREEGVGRQIAKNAVRT